MVSVTVVECVSVPLVPVMVTVNVPRLSPDEPVKVSTEVPDPPEDTVIEAGLKLAVTPVGGFAESVTVPLNPFRLVTVIVVETDPSLCIVTLAGEALMLKSGGGGAVTVKL